MLKQPRIKDKEWLSFQNELPCFFCRAKNESVIAHHIRAGGGGGTGLKPPDDRTLPTCHICHDEIHRHGEVKFYHKYKLTVMELIDIAEKMYQHYKEKK